MPISLISELIPQNSGQFALLDDAFQRGGFHVVDNLSTRNSIPSDRRKIGMRVAVQSNDIVYVLQSDLITWSIDRAFTIALQDAYDNGAEIQTTPGNAVTLTGIDTLSKIFIIKNLTDEILSVSANNLVEFNKTLRGKDYTSSISVNVNANASNIIVDTSDRTTYRAIQYFYTVRNSDNNGYETGQLYLIHDDINATIYSVIGNSVGTPCGIIFSAEVAGYNLNLRATTDNSISASRIIHLFKVALI